MMMKKDFQERVKAGGKGKKGKVKRDKKEVSARKDKVRIIYWNIAGMKKKGREFWNHIERFDVIGLCETWMEEREWEKTRSKLPSEFIWKCQYAERDKRRGRAKGGIVTGVRRRMEEIADDNVNGVHERRIDGEIWRILTVYKGGSMKALRKSLERMIGEREKENLCIGGDFNARIGGKGRKYEGGENEELGRNSKDKVINSEGKEMLGMLEERGWEVGNGNTSGDEEGEWTYIGSGGVSVVDYVLRNYRAGDKMERLEIGERVESDHQPIEVTLKTRMEREKKEGEEDIREINI